MLSALEIEAELVGLNCHRNYLLNEIDRLTILQNDSLKIFCISQLNRVEEKIANLMSQLDPPEYYHKLSDVFKDSFVEYKVKETVYSTNDAIQQYVSVLYKAIDEKYDAIFKELDK